MRIDGANNSEVYGPAGKPGQAPLSPKRADAERTEASGDIIAAEAACQPYIQKALGGDQVDLQAVAEAKKLIESGQLDTPEAARLAAEAMLASGL